MIVKKLIILTLLIASLFRSIVGKNQFSNAVSFDESMSKSYAYNSRFAVKSKNWKVVRNLFNLHMNKNLEYSIFPRIPKIIHWVWLGSKLPDKYEKLRKSWKKMHPGWIFKLWSDKDVEAFKLQNKKYFDKAKNFGEKSDIFRYEILYRYGGLYVDIDFECLKSFDILHHTCDLYTGIGYLEDVYLYNGLIGAVPQHPIIKACIDNMRLSGKPNDYDAIQLRTGPGHFTSNFFRILPKCRESKIVAFPITFFYPLPNNEKDTIKSSEDTKKWIAPESFCVHYWACSWVK